MFLAIIKDGNILVLGSSNPVAAWEEIIRRHCEANNVSDYKTLISTTKSYYLLVNEHTNIKAHITKLTLPTLGGGKVDLDSVNYLMSKGYRIDLSSKEKYIESLLVALTKRSNLMTRINMRRKEIEKLSSIEKIASEEKNLEQLLATISYQIKFSLDDSITLARFNEYNKILRLQAAVVNKNKN